MAKNPLRSLPLFYFALRKATKTKPPARKKRTKACIDAPSLNREARQILENIGESTLASRVKVLWYSRLRSTAGLACYREHTIYLNPKLTEFSPQEPGHTLRHELAHLLAQHRAGRRRIQHHGREWQQACTDLGIPDESATHSLPLPRATRPRPYVYACPHCHQTIHRTRSLKRASACYSCCRHHNKGNYDPRFHFQRVKTKAQSQA